MATLDNPAAAPGVASAGYRWYLGSQVLSILGVDDLINSAHVDLMLADLGSRQAS